jgi:hypothetical protein
MQISLPASATSYPVRLNGGLGEMRLRVPANTSATMEIQGGVGQVVVDTDSETALRVNGHGGIGDVKVPSRLTRVSGGDSYFEIGKTGVWESPGFEAAPHKLVINYQGGVGALHVR